jgi:uncharacterized membrane protein
MKLDSIPKFLDTLFKEHSGEMNPYVLKFFTYSETLTYVLACICVLVGFAISFKNLGRFVVKKGETYSDLVKTRISIGNFLNLSLTFILAGHVIRLIYSSHISTIFFLVVVILVRELMIYYLDKEIKELHHSYFEYKKLEKEKKFH